MTASTSARAWRAFRSIHRANIAACASAGVLPYCPQCGADLSIRARTRTPEYDSGDQVDLQCVDCRRFVPGVAVEHSTLQSLRIHRLVEAVLRS